jgi:hypothetical protein
VPTNNELMAQLARAGSLEDMFLEAVQSHWFDRCQGAWDWARGGGWGGQAPVCGHGWWRGRGQRGWGRQQHLGRALELRARAKEEVLHTLTSEDGLEGERALESLELREEEEQSRRLEEAGLQSASHRVSPVAPS